jgi:hypothetical protein
MDLFVNDKYHINYERKLKVVVTFVTLTIRWQNLKAV